MKIDELRKKHQKLIYKNFKIDHHDEDVIITSNFVLYPNIEFNPKVTIHGVGPEQLAYIPHEELNQYAFNIGMAEIFSYWKAAAPQEIIIEAGSLSQEQIDFWHDLLIQGMGEYFYVNKIDFTPQDFVRFSSPREITQVKQDQHQIRENNLSGVLLPLGGGKDSLVSLDLLKENYQEGISLFALNPIEAVREAVKLNPELPFITATRVIDPMLLELNKKGYLNGHTPFSSYIAFLSVFIARLFRIKYVAISNERSSNEESVIYKDHPVNHQYSKSYQLEENFQDYFNKLPLDEKPFYFSLLRPLYELQIAKLFSQKDTYLSIFISCNKGQKSNSWCCNCSKCLFAYIILYPFLEEDVVNDIFGINLLDNLSLWSTAKELLGYSHQKPLDCVGTHEESLIALYLCYQKQSKGKERLSKITALFEKEILPHEKNLKVRSKKILQSWNAHHSLPAEFDRILKYVYKNNFETQS
ncbi:MAG: hypothetical protein GW941_00610 [Candidatus Pacebacteria bacterium]|nr:hypothetical protein [Candidatus Paceibacterota bacterium]